MLGVRTFEKVDIFQGLDPLEGRIHQSFGGSPRPAVALRAMAWQPSLTSLRETAQACPAVAREASEGWWSQAGSNRRPLACHASALPAELWPLRPTDASGRRAGENRETQFENYLKCLRHRRRHQ